MKGFLQIWYLNSKEWKWTFITCGGRCRCFNKTNGIPRSLRSEKWLSDGFASIQLEIQLYTQIWDDAEKVTCPRQFLFLKAPHSVYSFANAA
jgi:hypothetical protein